jgi:TPP-dependent pyruvate/acetoin dehydrogenase alpha subunit
MDRRLNLGGHGIVGVPAGAGRLRRMYKKTGGVCLPSATGDQPGLNETLNLASLWKIPSSLSSRTTAWRWERRSSASAEKDSEGSGFNMPGELDGNDVDGHQVMRSRRCA